MKKNLTIIVASLTIILSGAIYFKLKYFEGNRSKVLNYGCCPNVIASAIVSGESEGVFEGKKVGIPQLSEDIYPLPVLGVSDQEKWIEVDLSDQRLIAWNGNSVFLETPVSTGLPWYPTPTGEFRIWIKLRATKMEGGEGKYYYYLPNVPFVMFFENESVAGWKGYGLHGTYWHNDFGTPRSHGCVNLPTEIAGQLFYWVTPELRENGWGIRSSAENPGTRIVIHE